MLYLFPNDIGTDAGCTQDHIDLTNISSINQRILDALIGNEQKYQQNIKYLFLNIILISFLNMIQVCYFSEAKVI